MAEVKITLTPEQWLAALTHQAKKKNRTVAEDIVAVWWGRMQAVNNYEQAQRANKRKGPERKPRNAKLEEPQEVDQSADGADRRELHGGDARVTEGEGRPRKGHKPKPIDLYDAPPVAVAKARRTEENGGPAATVTLKAAGRNAKGELK